ncbi:MAG: hypothetical protein K2X82_04710 [Gemmataceae bacterium]|nr:hypothetical protein [Gemmataceae bacterium]
MTDPAEQPAPDPAAFDRLRAALASGGPAAAVDRLIADLRAAEDHGALFYALLMKKRVELGVTPFPTGPAADLPPDTHEPYEQAIRDAGRHVGRLLLDKGDLPKAWTYFRMLAEPEPVREALERYEPSPDADIYPVVEIAWQQGVLPKKGFDLILDRHGVCSAITTVGGSDLNSNPDLRDYCVGRLVRALHAQLLDRLRGDLAARGTPAADGATIPQLLDAHPDLTADEAYHVDTSHLSSVCQMSLYLPAGPENRMAQELCQYGRRLAPGLRGGGDAPFDDTYEDYLAFLKVVAGEEVDAGLARFRAKADREFAEGATYAAQVCVNLLLRADRQKEALAAAKHYLAGEDERNLICPGPAELARRQNDFEALAEVARSRNDAVGFLAGLIAGAGVYPPVPSPS